MSVADKGYHDIVTENSVIELAVKEFNMHMLHSLFETREYLLEHYDLSEYDGIDQAEIALEIYKMRVDFETYHEVSVLTVAEVFEDESFQEVVEDYLENFEGF